MKKLISTMLIIGVLASSSITAFANESVSLDDLLDQESQTSQSQVQETPQEQETEDNIVVDEDYLERKENNKSFVDGLNDAADLSKPVDGMSTATSGIKLVASWIVQLLSYGLLALLAVRVILDLVYIGLPFFRGVLSNGYQGNAQAGAGGMPNSMTGSTGIGNVSGLGMGMTSGLGMGIGGNNMAMNRMGMANMGVNQNGAVLGRIQWVSNAALNAVAGESTVGPNGKAVSPFKLYIKDMVIVLIIVPILMTLAITGTLTELGFIITSWLVDAIASIGGMI